MCLSWGSLYGEGRIVLQPPFDDDRLSKGIGGVAAALASAAARGVTIEGTKSMRRCLSNAREGCTSATAGRSMSRQPSRYIDCPW